MSLYPQSVQSEDAQANHAHALSYFTAFSPVFCHCSPLPTGTDGDDCVHLAHQRERGAHPQREPCSSPHLSSFAALTMFSTLHAQARTVMIACISPTNVSVEHTLNTLRYADRVKGALRWEATFAIVPVFAAFLPRLSKGGWQLQCCLF